MDADDAPPTLAQALAPPSQAIWLIRPKHPNDLSKTSHASLLGVTMLTTVLLYALAPVATMALGGLIAAFRTPGPKLGSAIQHFAAGVVFAALAVEILPDVVHRDAPLASLGGFAAGVLLMLGLRVAGRRLEGEEGRNKDQSEGSTPSTDAGRRSLGMVLVVGTDVLIDGVLIGIAFAAGAKAGVLIAIALAIELLSLGLATSAALGKGGISRTRSILTTAGLALLPLVGAIAGTLLLGDLSGGWMEAVLAFAAATLLYLVTEELLVEAHAVPEAPWMTAMFFVGFVILLLIDMVGSPPGG
ncbi:ZIP family metal transporter [Rhodanobacter denitrificans]|jgi:zinc transporter, ZIP family|uniref:ZIP family metal transporter n=1 Tax=Rhodanobacter denitrificans TaxID=666685 RepID=UPI001930B3D5|nr:ZIP family metal transporter [Rhodanobacter denitrificans]UJM92016.1 ZIP family metal transporter [Rhodanobacter denitrificans]